MRRNGGPLVKIMQSGSAKANEDFTKISFTLFLILMPAFLIIIATLLLAMQYKQLHAFVSPQKMPMVEIARSAEAEAQIQARVQDFFRSKAESLSLDAPDLNHFLRTSASLMAQNLDYHIEIQDTLFLAKNSLPVEHLHGVLAFLARLLHVKGFLNSEMGGYPEFSKGRIHLIPVTATMNGIKAPISVLDKKGDIDPRDWVENKDFYDSAMTLLSEIKFRQGRLLFVKRR